MSREQRDRAEADEREKKSQTRAAEIAQLQRLDDPTERLLAAVAWLLSERSSAGWPRYREQTTADFAALTIPAVPSGIQINFDPQTRWSVMKSGPRWPWDSAKLGRWFAARAQWTFSPNVRLRRSAKPTDRAIELDSTTVWSGQDYSQRVHTSNLSVLEDGRVVSITPGGPSPYRYSFSVYRLPGVEKPWRDDWQVAELPPRGVAKMATILGLEASPRRHEA